jgi:hypothetical protein
MHQIIEFEYKKNDLDLYSVDISKNNSKNNTCKLVHFNSHISHNGKEIGIISYNTSYCKDKNISNALVTVTFNDKYNSSISWVMSWISSSPLFPPTAEFVIPIVSGTGMYLNKRGIVYIHVTPTDRKFYIKFDHNNKNEKKINDIIKNIHNQLKNNKSKTRNNSNSVKKNNNLKNNLNNLSRNLKL